MKLSLKYILTFITGLFSLTLFAQDPKTNDMNNYTEAWKEIEKLEYDGLSKSALEKVEQLYEKIKKDNENPVQTAQMIKALLFLNTYKARLEEDGLVKAIYRFEQEAENSTSPVKPILYSMVAEMYDQYLAHHLYKFRDRTEVTNYELSDIRTWDVQKITDKCYELYQKSLQYPEAQKVPLENFQAITYYANNSNGLHPTLYDFLMHRALSFFSSEKYYLTKPAYKFYLEQPEALGDAKSFINFKFEAKDSLSTQFQSLLLYQQLLSFHINDKDPRAFLHSELKRLNFVREKALFPEKDELYYKQLEALTQKYASNEAVAEVWWQIADFHRQKGNSYRPSPLQINRWELKKAIEICEQTIKKFPKSYGASHCEAMISDIKAKSMSMDIEKVNSIQSPILSSFSYKNLNKVYLKIVPLSDNEFEKFEETYYEDRVKFLNKRTAVHKWSETLIDEGDFQTHRLEMKLPSLPHGLYIVVISEKENFEYEANGLAYARFHVSNLAYINRQENGVHEYFVTDRISGAPQEDVTATFYENKYNSILRRYEWRKIYAQKTDSNGYVKTRVPSKSDYYSHNYRVVLSTSKDRLGLFDSQYNYNQEPDDDINYRTHFFLDRAIYRPGQTVYFKGIVVKTADKTPKKPEIAANYETEVIFYDVNYQEVARMSVTTNEFGSYEGSFTAPPTGLLGQMHLQDSYTQSQKYFRVEEYKRPKFEVDFKPLAGSFKVDEKVSVTGFAKAFAGSNIDGAKVSYRVVRQTNFPYWRWWYWGWYIPFNQEKMEIKFGETATDENGEFSIEFDAIPDRSVPKEQQPQFTYTVYADVIDITGETHSKQIVVNVGYVALNASVSISQNVDKDKTKHFKLYTQNLNGEFEAAKGNIKIEKLKTPDVIYRNRYWELPDYSLMTATDFEKNFPNYPLNEKDQVHKWAIEKEMLTKAFDSKATDLFELDMKTWEQGKYKLTLNSADKFGAKIERVYYFSVFDAMDKTVPLNDGLFLGQQHYYNLAPDTTVHVDFGAFRKEAWVLFEIEFENQIIDRRWIQPQGRTQIPVEILEKHRGNFSFHLNSIQDNRFYGNGGMFYVPWSNKELKIEYSTFRDKLYPGQEEEWRIKISGHKKDKVAAEVVAGMYDASLDAFAANYWSMYLYPSYYRALTLQSGACFTQTGSELIQHNWYSRAYGQNRSYPALNWYEFSFYEYAYAEGRVGSSSGGKGNQRYKKSAKMKSEAREEEADGVVDMLDQEAPSPELAAKADLKEKESENKPEEPKEETEDGDGEFDDVKVRTNLNETVFFMPMLMTDENGDVIIKFTMNESLTRWKFMTLAHTKDLQVMSDVKELVTQKDLMVMPNAPRFFRQGDEIHFTAKVTNLTENAMKGKAVLQLFDAISMEPIDLPFANKGATIDFNVEGNRSAPLSWKLEIPTDWTNAVTFRVIAKAGDFSDGEESSLPVLSNRMMVIETMPLPIRGGQTKTFEFKRMAEVSKSTTMRHHKYTLEFTQNPAWYAIQSLPYLMEYPYECTEQIFSRYYANSLATEVANSHPKIKRVFEQWKNIDTDALKSNLSKNQELKYALLEETPWVLNAQSEEQQKKNIGLLFDLNRMATELDRARDKMADRQLGNGGFAWFPGGRDSWYITQYIVEGMGHLDVLGVKDIKKDDKMSRMVSKSVSYCDDRLADMYTQLLRDAKRSEMGEKAYLELDHLNSMAIHFLYARSFFLDQAVNNGTTKKAIEYYENQAITYWRNKSMYMKGLLALGLHRKGQDKETPNKIVANMRENSLYSEEMGMYWKYPSGYFWYEAPIETHALMIEVFDEVANDSLAVDNLKVWLLKTKQTTNWKTTKATAAAVYALLRRGDNWLMDDQEIEIHLGGEKLDQSNIKKEAGTGYFKTTWAADKITAKMAEVKVHNPNKVVAWGAVYWQYFEQLDKITTFEETPLKINKHLFKQINTDRGPKLIPIDGPDTKLEPGDLVKVRIEIRVDRDMEYVHMKDMRAAGFEPVNVLSQYKYQGGMGYYESTRDASTNFFMDYLSKGTYVFEYDLRVNHKGDFSNGITTIQCMYAPEFTSHSEGVRVNIE